MTVTRCTQLKDDLAAARQALTDKKMGHEVLQFQTGAEMTRFAGTSVAKLESLIADIEAEFIGLSCPTLLGEALSATIPRRKRRGPLRGPIGRR